MSWNFITVCIQNWTVNISRTKCLMWISTSYTRSNDSRWIILASNIINSINLPCGGDNSCLIIHNGCLFLSVWMGSIPSALISTWISVLNDHVTVSWITTWWVSVLNDCVIVSLITSILYNTLIEDNIIVINICLIRKFFCSYSPWHKHLLISISLCMILWSHILIHI